MRTHVAKRSLSAVLLFAGAALAACQGLGGSAEESTFQVSATVEPSGSSGDFLATVRVDEVYPNGRRRTVAEPRVRLRPGEEARLETAGGAGRAPFLLQVGLPPLAELSDGARLLVESADPDATMIPVRMRVPVALQSVPAAPLRSDWRYVGVDVRAAVADIALRSGKQIVLPSSLDGSVRLDVADVSWSTALELVLAQRGHRYERVSSAVVHAVPMAPDALRETAFRLDCVGAPVRDVLKAIVDSAQVSVLLEPGVEGDVTLVCGAIPWSLAVRATAEAVHARARIELAERKAHVLPIVDL